MTDILTRLTDAVADQSRITAELITSLKEWQAFLEEQIKELTK
jgi:hypothetical protein